MSIVVRRPMAHPLPPSRPSGALLSGLPSGATRGIQRGSAEGRRPRQDGKQRETATAADIGEHGWILASLL
jgi:hypothetical protein